MASKKTVKAKDKPSKKRESRETKLFKLAPGFVDTPEAKAWRDQYEAHMRIVDKLRKRKEDLHPDLEACVDFGGPMPLIRHPLLVNYWVPSENAVFNYQYKNALENLKEAEEAKDWPRWISIHAEPFQVDAFAKAGDRLDDRQYWEFMGDVFTSSEVIWQQKSLVRKLLTAPRPGRDFIMSDVERETLAGLPDTLTVYRGYAFTNRKGWSWTIDRDKAVWFAKRFAILDGKAMVLDGTCQKSDVIAYFSRREESEILIDPNLVETGRAKAVPMEKPKV
jgi:hypothetical protein